LNRFVRGGFGFVLIVGFALEFRDNRDVHLIGFDTV
jgi:hypothetical protein